jgi:hypothetical protein
MYPEGPLTVRLIVLGFGPLGLSQDEWERPRWSNRCEAADRSGVPYGREIARYGAGARFDRKVEPGAAAKLCSHGSGSPSVVRPWVKG